MTKNARNSSIAIHPPYDVQWMLDFLARRAIAGIERVAGNAYERRLSADAVLRVHLSPTRATVEAPGSLDPAVVRDKVRRLFDLDADSVAIDAHLSSDPDMAARVRERPGLRVPGAWDTYELAVRAILGQQVSVDRATRLGEALVQRYGGEGQFPAPKVLARRNPAELGMPGRRGEAIRLLAEYFAKARDPNGDAADASALRASLMAIPGIGPWTAEYVAMRAGRDPNAFPASDWVVLKELNTTVAGARRRAAAWQPYAAYAVMYLWAAAGRRRALAKDRN